MRGNVSTLRTWQILAPSSSSMRSAPRSGAAVEGCRRSTPPRSSARVQKGLIDRSGIDPAEVGQVVGGCVSQVGEQSFNVTRTAWLSAGLPLETAATTIDTQCGSSQQATNLATSLIGSGVVDVAIACGVEVMSRIPIGSNSNKNLGLGVPIPKTYFSQYEMTSQFEGAERIADKWGISRDDTDRFGLASQERAARAWAEGRFDGQYLPIEAPDLGDDGEPLETTHLVDRDEGLRETSLEKLSQLKPVARENGVHTAGTSSQISDGAAALLMMTEEKAAALGLTPRARVVDTCLVGVDPVLMLTGPIDATQAARPHRSRQSTTSTCSRSMRRSRRSYWHGQRRPAPTSTRRTPTVGRSRSDIRSAERGRSS